MRAISTLGLLLLLSTCSARPPMSELTLSLDLQRTSFIESESMPFTVTLRNGTGRNLDLHSFDAANQSVTLAADAPGETQVLGTQISWKLREGERFHEPRRPPEFSLGGGEEATLDGDALAWLGTLPKGEYELYAAYNSGPNTYAESNRVRVTIAAAEPVMAAAESAPLHPAFALVHSAWLHGIAKNRYGLYLLESSPNVPANFFRNRQVAELAAPVVAQPSTAVMEAVPRRFVVWLDGEGILHGVAVEEPGGEARTFEVPLKIAEPRLLRSPLADEQGVLHALVTAADNRLRHVRLGADGRAKVQDIAAATIRDDAYALLWDRQGRAHLLFHPPGLRAIRYLRFSLSGDGAAPEEMTVDGLPGVPHNVLLRERFDEAAESYHYAAFVLLRTDDPAAPWQVLETELVPGAERKPGETSTRALSVPAAYVPVDAVIEAEGDPAFLFSDEEGTLFTVDGEGALSPVFDGEPMTTDDHPWLLAAGPFSHKKGLYVGYRRPEESIRFAYVP